ncbi:putative repeat protein (TIGR01451 family) [Methanohalophilus levihalophilus]|uniref:BatD family protein n=1 Tax=Methanohalophilus levihalophilus TaxID=1431282 RepID=UPI001AE63ECC|nr:BatD family protein [Methanohalophilus levihalophilus]MBP2029870.1 putative repeat protein (TIGR01451 family) [Methanohalophilus levihalophilus]
MYSPKRITTIFLLTMILFTAFTGMAAAKTVLYEDYINEGDGYQINNFVIDVTDVFPSSEYAAFYVYEKDEEVLDKGLDINDTFTFEVDGEDVEVKLLNTASGVLNKAKIAITIDDDDVVYVDGVVEGGHEDAEFSGTPELDITKSISSETISVGDIITVTVSVENRGDDTATEIRFSDIPPEKFIIEETFVSQTGELTLDVGQSQQIFVYRIKATAAGEYVIKPTTATFSNEAGQDFPQASSNVVTVTVEGEAVKTPELQFSATAGQNVVPRNENIEFTINIENIGEGSADAVSVELLLPDGLKYEDGDSEIEVISGVPTIYLQSFGVQQEKEITFTAKAESIGSYTITGDYSYLYDNGLEDEEVTGDFTSGTITVDKGRFDAILELPIYVYVIPVLVIIGIGAWVAYRHRQYRF